MDRRKFLAKAAMLGAGMPLLVSNNFSCLSFINSAKASKPVLLGGAKYPPANAPEWPIFGEEEYDQLSKALNSGKWGRLHGDITRTFEREYAQLQGAKHSLALSSGSAALTTMLGVMDIGPGDEVLLPVYTFVATYNVITLNHALPIFIDTDIETFQIDPGKIKKAITKNSRLLIPVHIGGSPCDIDSIMAIARQYEIPVIEDACQAHLATWRGKGVGTFGMGGAFSFQSTKNLNCAEGGAIVSNSEDFIRKCYCFHNQGRGINANAFLPGEGVRATNLRMTEFQAAILTAQMSRVERQSKRRSENASYLTSLLNQIDGITPAKLYDGTTNSAYHLYMFRYDASRFSNLSKERFIKALNAEGVACSAGYGAMNRDNYVTDLATNRHYLKIYGKKTMNQWLERNQCPQNDRLIQEAIWIPQTTLLGSKEQMDLIAMAINKIKLHASALSK